jgi:hypothetical protein
MEITSKELQNAIEVPPNSLFVEPIKNNSEKIKEDLKILLLLKNKSLLKTFEICEFKSFKSKTSIDVIINLLRLIKEELINHHKDDNTKNLTIRKTFDSIISSLELLSINKIDMDVDIINTIILAFLNKTFI